MAGAEQGRSRPAAAAQRPAQQAVQDTAQQAVQDTARPPGAVAAAHRLLAAGTGGEELNRIARLAARLLGSSSAQVSLLTDVQTVAGGSGLPAEVVGSRTPLSDSLCTVTASSEVPLVVPDARHDPRVSGLPPVVSGAVGAYLGVPLVADDEVVGVLCVFGPAPRTWSDADITVLEQLAASVVAELELSALAERYQTSRVRWELAIAAAGVGTFDWDLVSGRLSWDTTLLEMFGYDARTFAGSIESFTARLHPDDLPRVSRALQDAIEGTGSYEGEYRVLLPSGDTRWVQARGRVLADDAGRAIRMIGAASDTTDVREGEARVGRVLESMSAAFIALNREWCVTYVNAEAERLLGMDRGHLVGEVLWEAFPGLAGSAFETTYRQAMADRAPATVEAYYPAPLDAWLEVRAWPVPDGLTLYFLDVTARRAAQDLVQLSARVGEQLSGSLDIDDAVRQLAQLVVPRLADWSVVSVVLPDDTVRDLGCCHVDPAMLPVVERFMAARFDDREVKEAVQDARSLAEPVVVPAGATARAEAGLRSPAAVRALTELAPESAVVLPLIANGHVAGLLTLCRGAGRPALTAEEIDVAVSIAGRAGMALDNSRLYAEQRATAEQLRAANSRLRATAEHDRTVARALQDAMLTRLPEPDHLHLTARYLTATGTEMVGGDWYDALVLPTGATMLMIGDVAGHDIDAAAVMGQLRNLLRAFVWDRDEPPSRIVGRLDGAIHGMHLDTLATLALFRIEQRSEDRQNGTRMLRWTNAGHPPPVLVHADGTVVVLDPGTPDLLLGAAPHTGRHDHVRAVPPGATLLLYTDGLIETRTQDLDAGQRRLLDAVRAHHRLPPDELLDAVVADLVGEHPSDDVAVLAVRFNPEDRPRPAEAGPAHL